MAGLILLAFWMSVQEKSSVTVMEEKWIVLLLFPRSQKHGKIRTITIMLFFTATVAVNILLLSILRLLRGWASDFLTVKRAVLLITLPWNPFILFWKRKKSTWNTILLSIKLISDSLIILMGFIIIIVFTRLLIFCHPFNLKILYFTLNSFRLFVSSLLTMVQNCPVSPAGDPYSHNPTKKQSMLP